MKTNNKTLLLSLLVLLMIVSTTSQAQPHWEPVPVKFGGFYNVMDLKEKDDTIFMGGEFQVMSLFDSTKASANLGGIKQNSLHGM